MTLPPARSGDFPAPGRSACLVPGPAGRCHPFDTDGACATTRSGDGRRPGCPFPTLSVEAPSRPCGSVCTTDTNCYRCQTSNEGCNTLSWCVGDHLGTCAAGMANTIASRVFEPRTALERGHPDAFELPAGRLCRASGVRLLHNRCDQFRRSRFGGRRTGGHGSPGAVGGLLVRFSGGHGRLGLARRSADGQRPGGGLPIVGAVSGHRLDSTGGAPGEFVAAGE